MSHDGETRDAYPAGRPDGPYPVLFYPRVYVRACTYSLLPSRSTLYTTDVCMALLASLLSVAYCDCWIIQLPEYEAKASQNGWLWESL